MPVFGDENDLYEQPDYEYLYKTLKKHLPKMKRSDGRIPYIEILQFIETIEGK